MREGEGVYRRRALLREAANAKAGAAWSPPDIDTWSPKTLAPKSNASRRIGGHQAHQARRPKRPRPR